MVNVNHETSGEVTPDHRPNWVADELPGCIRTAVDLGVDPDGETDVVATVVRYAPSHPAATPDREGARAGGEDKNDDAAQGIGPRPAVLWVHGLSDYFFQVHLARAIHAAGWDFYAVDLRKCGRSHRPGQRRHFITDLALYDDDQTAALDIIAAEGHDRVVVGGHSTGGLVIAGWLDRLRTSDPRRHALIVGGLFDSPWLDLPVDDWKLPFMRPAVKLLGRLTPNRCIPEDSLGGYGESLHVSRHGEWDYDLEHKPLVGFPMPFSWLAAIVRAQDELARGLETGVPNLVLRSDRSWIGKPYSAATDSADAILDVEHIARRARCLGEGTRCAVIPGARHDVYLSAEHARALAFRETLDFLRHLAG